MILNLYIQWSKKETFHPGRGPEFPPYGKKSNFLGSSVFLYTGAKIFWPASIGKTYFASSGAESYLFCPLYSTLMLF